MELADKNRESHNIDQIQILLDSVETHIRTGDEYTENSIKCEMADKKPENVRIVDKN